MAIRLTLLLFCCFTVTLFAQNPVIYQNRADQALAYSYNNVSGNSANTVKRMLRDLSPNSYSRSRFELHYTQVVKAIKTSSKDLEVLVEFEHIYIDNLPTYRSIPMEEGFQPHKLQLTVFIERNGQVLKQTDLSSAAIREDGSTPPLIFNYTDSISSQDYQIRVTNVDFIFNSNSQQRLQQRIDWVNGYEQAAADLRNMTAQLQALNLQNPDPDVIPAFVGRIDALAQQYQLVHQADFWAGLGLSQNTVPDPMGIAQAEQNYQQTFDVVSARVSELMDNIHILYFDKGQVLLSQNNTAAAQNSFQRALEYQPQFAPAQIELAALSFQQGNIDLASEQLRQVLNTFPVDEQSQQRASSLLQDCRDAYLQQSRNLQQSGKFAQALARVNLAADICENTQYMNCNDNLVAQQRQSIFVSDFNQRRDVVQRLFQNNQLEKALDECEELLAFQEAEQIPVNFDTPALRKRILLDLLDRYLTAADRHFQQQAYREGLDDVKRAQGLREQYADILSATKIDAAYEKGYRGIVEKYQEQARQTLKEAQQQINNNYYERGIQKSLLGIGYYEQAQQLIQEQPRYLSPLTALERAGLEAENKHYEWLYEWTEQAVEQNRLQLAQDVLSDLQTWAQRPAVVAKQPARPEKLEEKVDYAVYLDLVARADALQAQNKQNEAISLYRKAQAIDLEHSFTQTGRGKDIGNKINSAAEQEIVQSARQFMRSTDNASIQAGLAQLQARAAEYGIARSPSVQSVFREMNERLCENAKERLYPNAEQEAIRLAKADEYIQAEEALQAAKELAREYSTCALDRSRLLGLANEIRACADFQRKLQAVKEQEASRRYQEAIKSWEELAELYKSAEVQNNLNAPMGIDLYDYFIRMNNARYIYIGALHFMDNRKKTKQAFELLKRAHQKGWDNRQARQLQERLGIWAAEQVYDPNRKWKDAVIDYIGTMKREFKFFRKAFKLRWKSM